MLRSRFAWMKSSATYQGRDIQLQPQRFIANAAQKHAVVKVCPVVRLSDEPLKKLRYRVIDGVRCGVGCPGQIEQGLAYRQIRVPVIAMVSKHDHQQIRRQLAFSDFSLRKSREQTLPALHRRPIEVLDK